MRLFFYDTETYWDRKTKHSLTHVHPVEYVMTPKTEIQVLTGCFDNGPVITVIGENKIREFFDSQRWDDTFMVAHNGNLFDHMITAWRFGIKPAMWGDTLAMGAPIFGMTAGGSLKKMAEALNVGKKGSLEATQTEGLYVKDWTSSMMDAILTYAGQDTLLCRAIFRKLYPQTSMRELRLIDLTCRMLVDPGFDCDLPALKQALIEEQERKLNALKSIANVMGVTDIDVMQKSLMSNPQFADLLARFDVDCPKKISPTTGRETLALAKTDQAFLDLLEHDNPIIAAAAQARLGAKSTILESRIKTFITMAEQHPANKMPIALNYWGASTGRWSGAMKANQQNLPRIPRDKTGQIIDKPTNILRLSLVAPRGHKVVVADLSGIELRVNHTLWKVADSMALYAEDPEADLYKSFAAKLYNKPKADVTKDERQFAKLCQLGLGYGMSAGKFRLTAHQQGVVLSQEEAEHAVATWREFYFDIVQGWNRCGDAIKCMARGTYLEIDPWGHCKTDKEIIHTPHSCLRYPDLRQEKDEETGKSNWVYGQGRNKRKIYGALACIAEGTPVLTNSGWKSIQDVETTDLLHDGVEWVPHDGLIYKSIRPCTPVDGVLMTPDHEVLTHEGWKEASQLQGSNRPEIWYVDSPSAPAQHRKNMGMGIPVRLWGRYPKGRKVSLPGSSIVLWLRHKIYVCSESTNSRYESAPSFRSLEVHDRSLSFAVASSVEKLRSTWHYGVRTVAGVLREFLGGYGGQLPAWAGPGPNQQRRPLLAGELSLGHTTDKYHEQTLHDKRSRYTSAGGRDRNSPQHLVLPGETRNRSHGSSGQEKSYPVYDILNAGPRKRFVVLGDKGPFVVHNCENLVQHLARTILSEQMLAISKQLPVSLSVHDEVVCIVPNHQAEDALQFMLDTMKTPPKWWPEIVLWAEGDIADSYGQAK